MADEGPTPLFEICDIPGKGKGLVATADIPRGALILSEKPLFTITEGVASEQSEDHLKALLDAVSEDQRNAFYNLFNVRPSLGPTCGIMSSNCQYCGEISKVGLCLTIARINHCCRPNARVTWDKPAGTQNLRAVKSIKAGEEITMSYFRVIELEPREKRCQVLQEIFRFTCICLHCTLPAAEVAASDKRGAQLLDLDQRLRSLDKPEDPIGKKPRKVLGWIRSAVQLLTKEYGEDLTRMIVYAKALDTLAWHGDQARSSVIAGRMAEICGVLNGEKCEDVRQYQAWARHPHKLPVYGQTKLWATKVNGAPRNLDKVAFKNWLWRQGSYADG